MKNITLKEYAELEDASAYDVLEHMDPANNFVGKQMNIQAMPYANVKYCFRLFGKVDKWEVVRSLFEISFDVNEQSFWSAPVTEFFAARKYLIRSFSDAAAAEARNMASPSTEEHLWQMAGADRLKSFGDILPLVSLGKQLGQYPFELGRKPYGEIMNLLIAMKVQGEVEQEYMKFKK